MTSRDFCYWLQGYFEITHCPSNGLTTSQVSKIEKHLSMVFAHEIDPSHGDAAHQANLNLIHDGTKPRC